MNKLFLIIFSNQACESDVFAMTAPWQDFSANSSEPPLESMIVQSALKLNELFGVFSIPFKYACVAASIFFCF